MKTPLEEFKERTLRVINKDKVNTEWAKTDKQKGYQDGYISGLNACIELIDEFYLEKEKSVIIDAYNEVNAGAGSGEEYYKETFKQD